MKLTRVDKEKLRDSVGQFKDSLAQMRTALEPLLETRLTDDERASILRAPTRLNEAARSLAFAAFERPTLAEAAQFDPEAVLEDLDNLDTLAGVGDALRELTQWIDDSELVWSGEAYDQSLKLYSVARSLVRSDGSLRPLVNPLADVFALRRKKAAPTE